jgi:hypothetical protein
LKNLLTILFGLALILVPSSVAFGQDDREMATAPLSKVPYRVGERLTYNVTFANFPTAAHIELWVAGYGSYFNRTGVHVRGHVETVGVVNAALFSVNNDYLAYINPDNGEPYMTQQFRREAGSSENMSREYQNRPQGTEAIPGKVRSANVPGTYDIVSALYRMRTLPLSDGSRYGMMMNINDVLYEAELRVTGREFVRTNVGSYSSIATQLRFRNSTIDALRIKIYFSDDERHVPVLFTAHHDSGDIRAELAGSELPGGQPAAADTTLPDVASAPAQIQPAPNPNAGQPSTVFSPGGVQGIPGISMNPNVPSPSGPNPNNPNAAGPNPNGPNPNGGNPTLTTPPDGGASGLKGFPGATPNRGGGTSGAPTPTALPAGLPFAAGEQLNFSIYVENVAQPVGEASFQVRARSKYFGRDGVMLTGYAKTTGAAQALFTANDQMTSYVDPSTLLPFRSETIQQESKRRLNQTITLDQDRGSITTDTGTKIEIPVGTYDLLSVFYALRSFNLKSPKPNAVSLFVNNRPRTLLIGFLKRETIELGGQQIPALQLSLITDDPQGDRNTLRLWVSEDQRRLPLRITAVTTAGKVRADLAIIPIVRQ